MSETIPTRPAGAALTAEPSSAPSPSPTQMPSFWEDAIEVFIHPVAVLRRRANAGFWPPMLFVAITIGIIGITTFDVLAPVYEAEAARAIAARGVNVPPDQLAKGLAIQMTVIRFATPVLVFIPVFLVGLLSWILSKFFDATTTFGQALTITAWAYFPQVLATIARTAQGLLMDPSRLTGTGAISLSPARFLPVPGGNVTATNPLVYYLLTRLDVFTIWETVLLAIGVYVTGKITKRQAVVFGVVIFLLGSLQMVQQGLTQM